MNKNLCPVGLPGPMRDALWSRISKRKNRHTTATFADWMFQVGLLFRAKDGFGLVRGSHRTIASGLKERADLQELGLTADKIRGAYELLVEVGFLDKEKVKNAEWRMNFRNQPRRPECTYRLSAEFRAIYYRACESGAAVRHWVKKTTVAAKRVALKLCSSVEANLKPSAAPFFSPLNVSLTFQDRAASRGEVRSPKSSRASPMTPLDRKIVEHCAAIEAHVPATLQDSQSSSSMPVEASPITRTQVEPEAAPAPRPKLQEATKLTTFDLAMIERNRAVLERSQPKPEPVAEPVIPAKPGGGFIDRILIQVGLAPRNTAPS